jgi:hypothetical protein
VRLLANLRDLFATTTVDRLATATIIRHLITLADRPGADYPPGPPLTPRLLAKRLEGFRIRAKQIRQGAVTRKGYLRADFADVFRRYLPRPATPIPRWHGTSPQRVAPSGAVSGDGRAKSRAPDCFDVSDVVPKIAGRYELSPS